MGSTTVDKNVKGMSLDKNEHFSPCSTRTTMSWQRGQHLTWQAQLLKGPPRSGGSHFWRRGFWKYEGLGPTSGLDWAFACWKA
uniref:Uncharacterized protein n=1 Tax=Cannabis sativa TaxID=3483 RepID=A0A803NKU9_CANSA